MIGDKVQFFILVCWDQINEDINEKNTINDSIKDSDTCWYIIHES